MRVAIVEDENKQRKLLVNLVKGNEYVADVMEASSVKEGVDLFKKQNIDLLLLDVNLPDGSGFDLLEKIKPANIKVIFITSFDSYAIKAFKYSAIDYVVKPVDPEELHQAIDKAKEMLELEDSQLKIDTLLSNINSPNEGGARILLNTLQEIFVVYTNQIIRCQSDGNYTKFFMDNGDAVMVSKKIKEYEPILKEHRFFRPHKSHLINLNYVESFRKSDGGAIIMKDKSEIPLAQVKREEFFGLL
ncbi:MAG: LytTR family DNA-binding domain-containing protein [Flavobacteriales bacterium]|nr:LytTR family DNA-binding domain-containing protein [Flavobacteriales bacterium]